MKQKKSIELKSQKLTKQIIKTKDCKQLKGGEGNGVIVIEDITIH